MKKTIQFFLARNQKVFGPLSAEEIEALRMSGQLSAYTWLYREGDDRWSPIDPPPALPDSPQIAAPAPLEPHAYRVVLFDQRNAISGWLVAASEDGCEIHSDQKGTDPLFVQKTPASLSLHDTRSGETIKLTVRISAIQRSNSAWVYRLRWKGTPSLLGLIPFTPFPV